MRMWKQWLHAGASGVVVAVALLFCIYPAVIVGVLLADPQLKRAGQSCWVPLWFESVAARYQAWASGYLASGTARSVDRTDVAATEWPMFGSVFFLATADELQKQGRIDARTGRLRAAVEQAAAVVASPDTATWVREKWGGTYLERENVFYRMLLILGLSSYERVTGDLRYRTLMSRQRSGLADELVKARFHMLDDYPGECWPNDVLWSVAAIQRAAALEGTNHNALAKGLMAVLDGPLKRAGLPAFMADRETGAIIQEPRGCGNSGILNFAAELDAAVAQDWYRAHEARFWKETRWLAGFTELPRGAGETFGDVDSGPVIWEFGSMATLFGIGASKAVGRMDRAAPMTLEAVACSWPTPFGFVIPAVMGEVAAGSGCLGEVALAFVMTRPVLVKEVVPFRGRAPGIVWVMLFAYAGTGLLFIGLEIRGWRRCLRERCAAREDTRQALEHDRLTGGGAHGQVGHTREVGE